MACGVEVKPRAGVPCVMSMQTPGIGTWLPQSRTRQTYGVKNASRPAIARKASRMEPTVTQMEVGAAPVAGAAFEPVLGDVAQLPVPGFEVEEMQWTERRVDEFGTM